MKRIIIDNFAGGGGASTGIEMATGVSPTFAINHDGIAMTMHKINHPKTIHLVEDVWKVDPAAICMGEQPWIAWFSPDCKHFSKAKGKKPLDRGTRGLAWVVVRYAKISRPEIMFLENVEEFKTWGPLLLDDTINKKKKGETFAMWVTKLRHYGYNVEWRELKACDYGVPTSRKRLFVIARCDGKPIVWPEPTHGPGREHPYRTAAECIDWGEPCPSIFEREKQGKRPLAEKTLRRIARGIVKYVVEAKQPFIVPVTHAGDNRVHSISDPFRTVTGANRGELAFVAPTLIQTGYGERKGQAPRSLDLHEPLGTIVAGGNKHALVSAFLAKHYGERDGGFAGGSPLDMPAPTMTSTNNKSLVATHMLKLRGTSRDGQPMTEPVPTITAGGTHLAEVRSFLERYYGERDDFVVWIDGEPWVIVDIGMRMLTPRELFRAQGFPDDYIIAPDYNGKPLSKTNQVRMCGNSVPPPMAKVLIEANAFGESRARVQA